MYAVMLAEAAGISFVNKKKIGSDDNSQKYLYCGYLRRDKKDECARSDCSQQRNKPPEDH